MKLNYFNILNVKTSLVDFCKRLNPCMRKIFTGNLFRAGHLKATRYPEISYRKFCTEEYLGLDRKLNRVCTGLSLSKKDMIDHTQLGQFRKSLFFVVFEKNV